VHFIFNEIIKFENFAIVDCPAKFFHFKKYFWDYSLNIDNLNSSSINSSSIIAQTEYTQLTSSKCPKFQQFLATKNPIQLCQTKWLLSFISHAYIHNKLENLHCGRKKSIEDPFNANIVNMWTIFYIMLVDNGIEIEQEQ